jgi:hypothetical protein
MHHDCLRLWEAGSGRRLGIVSLISSCLLGRKSRPEDAVFHSYIEVIQTTCRFSHQD